MDPQRQNSADNLAENTLYALEFISPICLPKPESLDIIEKRLHRVSVVRDWTQDSV